MTSGNDYTTDAASKQGIRLYTVVHRGRYIDTQTPTPEQLSSRMTDPEEWNNPLRGEGEKGSEEQ